VAGRARLQTAAIDALGHCLGNRTRRLLAAVVQPVLGALVAGPLQFFPNLLG
jgi:hypothetical protein